MSKLVSLASRNFIRPHILQLWMYGPSRSTHWCIVQAGNREQVGFGVNGKPIYFDRVDYPFPAVRWKEPTPEICCLWEKEKGDWSKLTCKEKKELYRASFRQTYAEFKAPYPEWKFIIAMIIWIFTITLWFTYLTRFVEPDLPHTYGQEYREAQFRRIIDLETNPIQGLASRWDYERDTWKK